MIPAPVSQAPVTPPMAPLRTALVALPLLVVLGLGYAGYRGLQQTIGNIERQLTVLTEANHELTQAMQLYRYERGSKGLGVQALLDQMRHWAPMLQNASTPAATVPTIEKRMHEILDAMVALGPDAFAAVQQALLQTDTHQDELAKWLLRAAQRVDPARAEELLVRVIQRDQITVSPRLRMIAADQLIALDKERAGAVLRQILRQESHTGLVPSRLSVDQADVIPAGMAQATPEFFNFIDRYVSTGDPEVEATLLMILGRPEHDTLTVQSTVKALGALRAKAAVDRIQQLFEKPVGAVDNPLFRNHCLEALAQIQGKEACAFFDAALTKEQNALVANKLKDLIKRHCD